MVTMAYQCFLNLYFAAGGEQQYEPNCFRGCFIEQPTALVGLK